MAKKNNRINRAATTTGLLVAVILFSAVATTAILSYSNGTAFAQPSNNTPFKGNVTGAIISSEKGDEKSPAGTAANASASASYKPSYPKERADENRPFTLHTEKHLYKPGEEVKVDGSIWTSLIDKIGNVTNVKMNVTDNKGNATVSQKTAQVDDSGVFTATFSLPENAEQGSYSIDAIIEVQANILDTLKADVKSKLETSARFEVVSPNAFAVKAQDGKSFSLEIASNSTISEPEFKQEEKTISLHVEGQTGTRGITEITIPKALLSGQITVSIDGKVIPPESSDVVTIADTEEGMTLEINYHHSEHTIDISGTSVVPEFPLPIMAAIVGITGVVAFTRLKGWKLS